MNDGERSSTYWGDRSAAGLLADDPAHSGAALSRADQAYFSGITLAIVAVDAHESLSAVIHTAQAIETYE